MIFPNVKSDNHLACCCSFKKDPFRGFQLPKYQIISTPKSEIIATEDIANKLIQQCEEMSKGVLTEESLERLKLDKTHELKPEKCERECLYLTRQLNDNYIIEQVKTRNAKAEKLKKEQKRLQKIINEKVKINVQCLSQHKRTTETIASHTYDHCFNELDIISNNNNTLENEEDDMRMDSIGSNDSCEDIEATLRKLNDEEESVLGNTYVDRDNYDERGLDNLQIQDLIQDIKIKVMYLQKKNFKPIDYILDRFNIKDNILAMLINLFEKTLNDVMEAKKDDLKRYIKYNFMKSQAKAED